MSERYTFVIVLYWIRVSFFFFLNGFDASKVVLEVKIEVGLSKRGYT